MATTGDSHMATSGDFFMATDKKPGIFADSSSSAETSDILTHFSAVLHGHLSRRYTDFHPVVIEPARQRRHFATYKCELPEPTRAGQKSANGLDSK